jgi:hypothetical protein
VDSHEWAKLWKAVSQVQDGFEPGAVFIGGVAVFAHTKESLQFNTYYAFSHDADFIISVVDFIDLRDIEHVVSNRRLSKSQFYKGGFEFDVYVEGQNDLPVPYAEVASLSEIRNGIRVASLEHLLVMKLKAFEDRRGSAKGTKDEDDLIKLLMLLSERDVSPDGLVRLDEDALTLLDGVVKSEAPIRVAAGNAHLASGLRRSAISGLEKVLFCLSNSSKMNW